MRYWQLSRKAKYDYFTNFAMVHEKELVVENITAFIKYSPVACFKRFTREVVNARRKADENTWDVAAGKNSKLIGAYRCVFQIKHFYFWKYILNHIFNFLRKRSLWQNDHEQREICQHHISQKRREHNTLHEQPVVLWHGENSAWYISNVDASRSNCSWSAN